MPMPASTGPLAPVLATVDGWGAAHVSVVAVDATGAVIAKRGPSHRYRLASVTKPLFAYAVLIAVEEGTLSLDEPVPDGPDGTTVRHLLAHTSGLPFTGRRPLAPAGKRRIYSNTGYTLLGHHLASRASIPAAEYLRLAVLEPLSMAHTALEGSPAGAAWSTTDDLARWMAELFRPQLLAPATLAEATTPQWPELGGVIPGIGRFRPCPWGLGFELRGTKQPHWTGTANSPSTFGHFGGTGTFLWVDPAAGLSLCALTDRAFGDWALDAWPPFSDAVLKAQSPERSPGAQSSRRSPRSAVPERVRDQSHTMRR